MPTTSSHRVIHIRLTHIFDGAEAAALADTPAPWSPGLVACWCSRRQRKAFPVSGVLMTTTSRLLFRHRMGWSALERALKSNTRIEWLDVAPDRVQWIHTKWWAFKISPPHEPCTGRTIQESNKSFLSFGYRAHKMQFRDHIANWLILNECTPRESKTGSIRETHRLAVDAFTLCQRESTSPLACRTSARLERFASIARTTADSDYNWLLLVSSSGVSPRECCTPTKYEQNRVWSYSLPATVLCTTTSP